MTTWRGRCGMSKQETYLGYGLYGSVNDTRQIVLHAPRKADDHFVYLDYDTFHSLCEYAQTVWAVDIALSARSRKGKRGNVRNAADT